MPEVDKSNKTDYVYLRTFIFYSLRILFISEGHGYSEERQKIRVLLAKMGSGMTIGLVTMYYYYLMSINVAK